VSDHSARSRPSIAQARARSLILRIWHEPRDFEGEAPLWRGSIAELDGSNTRYFDSTAALCRLVADLTGADTIRQETAA